MIQKKKLIEVALPLEAINIASAREKSIRHGHPSTLHLWWARRPLAAARAVIFAQMVDDPSAYVDVLRSDPKLRRKAETTLKARQKLWEEASALARKAKGTGLSVPEPGPAPTLDDMLAQAERDRLFEIIKKLVLWENTTDETVLQSARDEIWASWRRACAENVDHPRAKELFDRKKLPAFHDPFAGGGALPLEAQRLGLKSYASDLNPVAVLINKAMIEIPPKFADKPPVNPVSQRQKAQMERIWHGAQGLAEDVHYYGQWMRDEAEKRIGHFYPKIEITAGMAKERPDLKKYAGQKLTVIAWLWARTVKSPNPAFANSDVPLASSFLLSTKVGKEAYIEPVVEGNHFRFTVRIGKPSVGENPKEGTKIVGSSFRCLFSGAPISGDYIRSEAQAGRMSAQMMAIAAEGERGRVYLPPTPEMEAIARTAVPIWKPDIPFFQEALGFRVGNYGLTKWSDLFTPRQLMALTTFSDLIDEAHEKAKQDAMDADVPDDGSRLDGTGTGATAYADALAVYLAFTLDRLMQQFSTLAVWSSNPAHELVVNMFSRQTLSMTWDFGEVNPFSSAASWEKCLDFLVKPLGSFASDDGHRPGISVQADAQVQSLSVGKIVSTDPPYYDNIGYADLSDYFYVWLRRALKPIFPEIFATRYRRQRSWWLRHTDMAGRRRQKHFLWKE